MTSRLVWYVGYGSNARAERFACYLAGGTPVGATRGYPGCRDTSPPLDTRAVEVPGGIYFATGSPVRLGGRAFYDPDLPGTTAARAYLVTAAQFADVAAQEMYRDPGADFDLTVVQADGRHVVGPGRYETLLRLGEHDGHPALTFTAPWGAADVEHTKPSANYLTMPATGLAEAHGRPVGRIADYLARATPFWTAADIGALIGPPAGVTGRS